MSQDQSLQRDKVVQIINSVVSKVESAETISKEAIFQELKSLQDIITETRKELGYTGAADISATHIPTATDELDAVIEATASATGAIMDSCEVISAKAGTIETPEGAAITDEVTKIFEACSFQDITGQRISKVVTTLRTIEEKVDSLMKVLSDKLPGIEHTSTAQDERTGDEALLNGPQMAGQGVTQDDIDALLDDLF